MLIRTKERDDFGRKRPGTVLSFAARPLVLAVVPMSFEVSSWFQITDGRHLLLERVANVPE